MDSYFRQLDPLVDMTVDESRVRAYCHGPFSLGDAYSIVVVTQAENRWWHSNQRFLSRWVIGRVQASSGEILAMAGEGGSILDSGARIDTLIFENLPTTDSHWRFALEFRELNKTFFYERNPPNWKHQ